MSTSMKVSELDLPKLPENTQKLVKDLKDLKIDMPGLVVQARWMDYSNAEIFEQVITDRYQGEWYSELEFIETLINDTEDLSKMGYLADYIDYEKLRRDWFELGGEYFSVEFEGKKHIFSNR